MRYCFFPLITLASTICSLLEGNVEQDPTLQAFDRKIEEIDKQLKENWKETTEEEVREQDDFIANWLEYRENLNAIKSLNDHRQKLQQELQTVEQARTDYLKSKAKAE